MSSTRPPDPPTPSEKLMAVGNRCRDCGNEQGLFFPDGARCAFCTPQKQPNGRVITAVAYSPVGTTADSRLPNTTLRIDDDSTVTFRHGDHKDVVWRNGPPTIETDADVGYVMVRTQTAPPPLYTVYFKE